MDQSDVVSVPSTVSTSATKKAKGSPVIENIQSALGYDNTMLTQLKTLSGWFKNSEDTVQEYAAHCSLVWDCVAENYSPSCRNIAQTIQKRRTFVFFSISIKNRQEERGATTASRPGP